MTSPKPGGVERATRADLRRLGWSVQSNAMAATAVALSREIDASVAAASVESLLADGARSRSAAQAAAQLRLIMADLEKSAVRPEKDAIDELNARRAVRREAAG